MKQQTHKINKQKQTYKYNNKQQPTKNYKQKNKYKTLTSKHINTQKNTNKGTAKQHRTI